MLKQDNQEMDVQAQPLKVLVVGNINWLNLREMHIKPLVQAGHKVTVLTDDKPSQVCALGLESCIALDAPKFTLSAAGYAIRQLAKLIATAKVFSHKERKRWRFLSKRSLRYSHQVAEIADSFDIVHCHFLTRPVCIAAYASGCNTPIVSTIHGSDIYVSPTNTTIDLDYIRCAFNRSQAIVVPGEREKVAASNWGAENDQLAVVPWGVDQQQFFPPASSARVTELRDKWQVSGEKVLLSVRNLKEIYNVGSVLQAFAQISKKADYQLLIAGDGELKSHLTEYAQQLGVTDNVRFIGRVDHQQLTELYQLSDLYVQNPLSDALPYSILECISCGTPIVAGGIGSIGDIEASFEQAGFKRSVFLETGVLTADNLAQLIQRGLTQSQKYLRSDREYLRFIERQYSIDAATRAIVDIYHQCIEAR